MIPSTPSKKSPEATSATPDQKSTRKGPAREQNVDPNVRMPLPSTTREDIERADGEGMAPVPPPRPHDTEPREEKSSHGY